MRRRIVCLMLLAVLGSLMLLRAIASPAPVSEPAAPSASTPVKRLLDESLRLLQAQKPTDALTVADKALAVALANPDLSGRALAQRARARCLEALNRSKEAVTAWRGVVAAWQLTHQGPEEVEALLRQALLLTPGEMDESHQLVEQAASRARSESRRPLAAAAALNDAGIDFAKRGRLRDARQVFLTALAIREQLAPSPDYA